MNEQDTKNDFRCIACHYKYVDKGDELLKNITKKKKGLGNESEYLKS